MTHWRLLRRAAPRILAGTAAALMVSCAPRIHAEHPCTAPAVAISDWQEARGSAFTLRLPPDFRRVAVQGIDSEVGEWSNGEATVGYDYGRYSDRLENAPQGASAVEICETTIGGRPARVRRYRTEKGDYAVEAHWPWTENSLTLWGVARTPRDANVLLAIVHSVRLRQAAGDESSLSPASPRASSAARLMWMAGCWERRRGARLVEEQWMTPRAGVMLGASRTVRGDTLVEYEQLRIFERDGKLIFAATPWKQPPAEFASSEATDSTVIFANPTHDFPQRVMYRKRGADSLLARVEGMEKGQARGIDFPYRRTSCF